MNKPDGEAPATVPAVPDDVVDLLRPGDHAPTAPPAGAARCAVAWLDVQDLLGGDPPWRCRRPAGHRGQHVAFGHGASHVAAVLPPP